MLGAIKMSLRRLMIVQITKERIFNALAAISVANLVKKDHISGVSEAE